MLALALVERKHRAAAFHCIDDQLGVPGIFEMRRTDPELRATDAAEPSALIRSAMTGMVLVKGVCMRGSLKMALPARCRRIRLFLQLAVPNIAIINLPWAILAAFRACLMPDSAMTAIRWR